MVLFTSNRPLYRAENIKAVYDAYDGRKEFIQTDPWRRDDRLSSHKYAIRVCDEFISASPGKAVMIGHAISGGKTYGLDQPNPYHNRRNAELLTHVIASSEEMIPLVAKQSGVLESHVLPLGTPRTDAYIGARKGDGGTFLAEKRAYLFAPTFRNAGESDYPRIDWEWLDAHLTDEEIFVVKPHMVKKHMLDGHWKHLVEVPSTDPSTPYLMDCDVLITDYSSIMFDAHVLRKPVVLFEKNKGYVQTRGMYLEYPGGYSSRYCTDEKELLDLLRQADRPQKEDRECLRRTASACDGHASERVARLIKEML